MFVETLGPKRFSTQDSDPKSALRLGCAAARRVSQFIVVPEDADTAVSHRAKAAVVDGMRQLGAVVPPNHRLDEKLADNLQYLALCYVRARQTAQPDRPGSAWSLPASGHTIRCIPYAAGTTLTRSGSRTPNYCSPSLPTDRYRRARRRLNQPGSPLTRDERRDEVERQVRSLLYQVRDRPTLLLANSGNLREAWPGLNNGQLARDMVTFNGEQPTRLTLYGAGLRAVLIRDANSRGETPEWYAPSETDEEPPGFSAGLWAACDADQDNRVFVSTVGKPPTAGTVRRDLRKLVPDTDWPHGPAATAWNPQALELTVLGCLSEAALAAAGSTDSKPEQPAVFAAAVHQLRFHDEYHPLARPLQLHLAKLAEEYVLPLAP
ncbi:RNaseH domain-containing protein [Streptomyces sp. NPDC088847]|uniref:RNaseH domain-containing protein n=1 Tax=Streptomyces sp. NPDC088847 TaxID=3365909 RepID=UPI0037FE309B